MVKTEQADVPVVCCTALVGDCAPNDCVRCQNHLLLSTGLSRLSLFTNRQMFSAVVANTRSMFCTLFLLRQMRQWDMGVLAKYFYSRIFIIFQRKFASVEK